MVYNLCVVGFNIFIIMKIRILSIIVFSLFTTVLLQATDVDWGHVLQQSHHVEAAIPYSPETQVPDSYGIDGLDELELSKHEGLSSFRITYSNSDGDVINGLAFLPNKSIDSAPIKFIISQHCGVGMMRNGVVDAATLINFVELGYAVFISDLIDRICEIDEYTDMDDVFSFLECIKSISSHINAQDYTLLGVSTGCTVITLMIERLRREDKQLPHRVILYAPLVHYIKINKRYGRYATEKPKSFASRSLMHAGLVDAMLSSTMLMYAGLIDRLYSRSVDIFHGIDLLILHTALEEFSSIKDPFCHIKDHRHCKATTSARTFIHIDSLEKNEFGVILNDKFSVVNVEAFNLVKLFLEGELVDDRETDLPASVYS